MREFKVLCVPLVILGNFVLNLNLFQSPSSRRPPKDGLGLGHKQRLFGVPGPRRAGRSGRGRRPAHRQEVQWWGQGAGWDRWQWRRWRRPREGQSWRQGKGRSWRKGRRWRRHPAEVQAGHGGPQGDQEVPEDDGPAGAQAPLLQVTPGHLGGLGPAVPHVPA